MSHNIAVLKNWSQKWIVSLEENSCGVWSFYHSWNIVYKFGLFLPQFWLYDVTRIFKFPILEKWQKIKFFTLKYIHGFKFKILYYCLVAIYCFETALRIRESEIKEEPPLHTFLHIFYKSLTILALSYNISHFVPIFNKIGGKLAQEVYNSNYLCNSLLQINNRLLYKESIIYL